MTEAWMAQLYDVYNIITLYVSVDINNNNNINLF